MLGLQQGILQEQVQHSTEGRNDRLTWKNRPKGRIPQARDTMKERLYTANPNTNRQREHRRALGLLRVQWFFYEATTCTEGVLHGLISPFCSGRWHHNRTSHW